MTDLILFLFTTAGGGGWYVWTGYIRRRKPCKNCGGFGYKHRRNLLSASALRPCPTCDGEGEVLRFAARHVQRRHAVRTARTARSVRAAQKASSQRDGRRAVNLR